MRVSSTVTADVEINDRPDPDVYDSQKSLVLLLKLFLIEDLDGKDTIFIRPPMAQLECTLAQHQRFALHIETLVPVWIQCLFNHGRGSGLFARYRADRKRVWKSCSLLSDKSIAPCPRVCSLNTSRL